MGYNSHADMDALSAKYAVCMQTSALNNQLYADKWGSGWAKQWLIMLKKMPISLQNSTSPQSLSKGRGGVVCIVTSLQAVGLCS